jgi:uncharacterized protein YggE
MDEEKISEYMNMKCCKNSVKILIGAVLVVLTVFIAAKAINEIRNEGKTIQDVQNTIAVSAEGKIFAKPDIGEINLGVTNEAKTVAEAQKKSTDAINKIMDFLKNSGIEDKDIKTTNYSIYPVYDYTERKQVLRGYSVSQSLDIKIRDLAKSGDIISGAANNGANVIGGLNFTIDDLDVVKEQARQEAIKKAQVKAKVLASELGIKLGKLVSFSESGGYPIYYEKSMALGIGGGESVPSPSIPTGENEIIVSVNLVYKIK